MLYRALVLFIFDDYAWGDPMPPPPPYETPPVCLWVTVDLYDYLHCSHNEYKKKFHVKKDTGSIPFHSLHFVSVVQNLLSAAAPVCIKKHKIVHVTKQDFLLVDISLVLH